MTVAEPRTLLADAVALVRRHWATRPRVGIILGSGLGALAASMRVDVELAAAAIPGCIAPTAPAHHGRWLCGTLEGVPAVVLDGRLHGYEGHTAEQTAFPVRVLAELGIEILVLTNACGGLNPQLRPGDVVVVDDHLNLTWDNPLVGATTNHPQGFPDLSQPYDHELAERALALARGQGFVAHRGVYAGVVGPNYETRAEYRLLRRIGADVVGMSTVAETIVAVQCGLRVLGLSVVTNVCLPDAPSTTTAEQVIAAASQALPRMRALVAETLAGLAATPSR